MHVSHGIHILTSCLHYKEGGINTQTNTIKQKNVKNNILEHFQSKQ